MQGCRWERRSKIKRVEKVRVPERVREKDEGKGNQQQRRRVSKEDKIRSKWIGEDVLGMKRES